MEKLYALIMAGGSGERFWPASREQRPKQLMKIFGKTTLLEAAYNRVRRSIPVERILVITGAVQAQGVAAVLPELPAANLIAEPVGRDTAPCVALGAGIVRQMGGDDAVMAVLPADPLIEDAAAFDADFRACSELAAQGEYLVTIGVPPTTPSTAYGYIECGKAMAGKEQIFAVDSFREKPDAATALSFLESGRFLWNCGMFFWNCRMLMEEFRKNAPDLADLSERLGAEWGRPDFAAALRREYAVCRRISIDYAVVERCKRIAVRPAGFRWDDVGSWEALSRHFAADAEGNVALGTNELLDCRDNVVYSADPKHLVCGIGIENLIVVHTGDATLVCRRSEAAKIKELLRNLRGKNPPPDLI